MCLILSFKAEALFILAGRRRSEFSIFVIVNFTWADGAEFRFWVPFLFLVSPLSLPILPLCELTESAYLPSSRPRRRRKKFNGSRKIFREVLESASTSFLGIRRLQNKKKLNGTDMVDPATLFACVSKCGTQLTASSTIVLA